MLKLFNKIELVLKLILLDMILNNSLCRIFKNYLQSGTYNKRPGEASLGHHSQCLQHHFNDVIKRSFRFATNNEKNMIQVSEYMAESKWTYELPIQLL